MVRDLDLIRSLLLKMEESSDEIITSSSLVAEGYSHDVVERHLRLLDDAKFIDAKMHRNIWGKDYVIVNCITMGGYDYLDSVRNSSVWAKVKGRLSLLPGGAASVALDVIKSLAAEIIIQQLSS